MLLRFVGPTVQLHTRPSFCSGEAAVGCLGRAEPERAQRIKASAVPRRAVCGAALFDVPGGIAELGQHELHAPELTLRAEAVLAEDLHLLVEALLLERAARLLEGLAICCCGRTAGPSQHASQAMRSSGSAAAVRRRSRGRGGAVAARFTLRGGGTHACTTTACLATSALGPAAACTPLGLVVSGLDAHAANKKNSTRAYERCLPIARARARRVPAASARRTTPAGIAMTVCRPQYSTPRRGRANPSCARRGPPPPRSPPPSCARGGGSKRHQKKRGKGEEKKGEARGRRRRAAAAAAQPRALRRPLPEPLASSSRATYGCGSWQPSPWWQAGARRTRCGAAPAQAKPPPALARRRRPAADRSRGVSARG